MSAAPKTPLSPATKPNRVIRKPKQAPASPKTKTKETVASPSPKSPPEELHVAEHSSPEVTPQALEQDYGDHDHDDVYQAQMDAMKKKHQWRKPGWALPAEELESDDLVLKDPINNDKLKAVQHSGYVRHVHPNDNLEIINGTHVKPVEKMEPRLVWLVVGIDDKKAGKIVMHLYGKDVNGLVNSFVDLKGFEMLRGSRVIVETRDPFESNRTLKGKLVDRNAMDLMINKKGRMVTVPLNFVKSVRLPAKMSNRSDRIYTQ